MWPDLYHGEENRTANNSIGSVPFDHIRSSLLSWHGEFSVPLWLNQSVYFAEMLDISRVTNFLGLNHYSEQQVQRNSRCSAAFASVVWLGFVFSMVLSVQPPAWAR